MHAPAPVPVNVTVGGLSPSTPATQSAVQAELADAFQRLGLVSGNASPNPALPFLAVPATFSAIWIDQAVANATGVVRGTLIAPSADVGLGPGAIAGAGNDHVHLSCHCPA